MIRVIILFFLTFLLISCKKIDSSIIKKPILIDYKSDTYGVYIGDNYKKSSKIIGWQWDAERDPDRKIDSTGIDTFLCLGEPTIIYNSNEYLPALFIETKRNIIRRFHCSILFNLKDYKNAENDFLTLISKDFKKLQSDSIKELIIQKGTYKIINKNTTETYKLTKHKGITNYTFEYIMEIKNAFN